MGQRARIFKLEVVGCDTNVRYPVGNLDGNNCSLSDLVADLASDLSRTRDQGDYHSVLTQVTSDRSRSDLLWIGGRVGASGIYEVITRDDSSQPYIREEDQTGWVDCGALIDLNRSYDFGFALFHFNDRRSLLQFFRHSINERLQTISSSIGEELSLDLSPNVDTQAFRQAVSEGKVKSLIWSRTSLNHRDYDTESDVILEEHQEVNEKRLLSAQGRGKFLALSDGMKRWVTGDAEDSVSELLSFGQTRFDEVEVRVRLPDGTYRTYVVEGGTDSRTMSYELTKSLKVPKRVTSDNLHLVESALNRLLPKR
jgi:hypothetical protein